MERSLLVRCRALGASTVTDVGTIALREIASVLATGDLSDAEVASLARTDPSKPYGRRVVIDTDRLEGMVAQWTRGVPCAPHDHGGASGAVRVLRGEAVHTVWRVEGDDLVPVRTHRATPGDVLRCGPSMVHSMVDGGASEPLVTLHLYADPIDHMIVYDLDAGETYTVDGGCGAWVPHEQPELVRSRQEGVVRPRA
jgi:predicted metal-dependent enzyme (double-stranded beta helix superfamily)